MVLGSALEITVCAPMLSPDSSTTPEARSPSTKILATGAPARIVAPAALAALASALHSAPMPPLGWDMPEAPAADSAAKRYSSVNTVPGERGPKLAPSTASNPSAPLSAADSKFSSSKSKTFMPPIRSSSRMSRLPNLRICQPIRSSASRSAQPSFPKRGGTRENIGTSAAAKRRMRAV